MSSYIKWFEMTGSNVVPIRIDWPMEMIEPILDSVNALFFPGGGTGLWANPPPPKNGSGVSNFTAFAIKAH